MTKTGPLPSDPSPRSDAGSTQSHASLRGDWKGNLPGVLIVLWLTALSVGTARLAVWDVWGWMAGFGVAGTIWLGAVLATSMGRMVVGDSVLRLAFLAGALARLAQVFCPPILSDDIYRYVWEGRVLLAGWNPYAVPPLDGRLSQLALGAGEFAFVSHGTIPAVYPPLCLGFFAAVVAAGGGVFAIKFLLAVVELATLAAAARWLTAAARPGIVLWLGCPLAVVEIAGSGHFDALALAGIVAVLGGLHHREHPRAGALLLAGLALVASTRPAWGALLLVLVLGRIPLRQAVPAIAVAMAAIAVAVAPPLLSTERNALANYTAKWSGNGLVYEGLRGLLYRLDTGGAISGAAPWLVPEYLLARSPHPVDAVTRMGLGAGILAVAFWVLRSKRAAAEVWLRAVVLVLLLFPVVHPWYVLPAVAGLLFACPSPASCWLLAVVGAAYAVLPRFWASGVWEAPIWVWWVQYPVLLILLLYEEFAKEKSLGPVAAPTLHPSAN